MVYESGLTVRIAPALVERAKQLARDMSRLSTYDVLGVTPKSVLRIALTEGAGMVENVDPKYFKPEEAERLKKELHVNPLNVMLKADSYTDLVFTRAVLAHGRVNAAATESEAKETSVDLRLPKRLLDRVSRAIQKGVKGGISSSSSVVRIIVEVGLVRLEAKVYWELKKEGWDEDKTERRRRGKAGRPRATTSSS